MRIFSLAVLSMNFFGSTSVSGALTPKGRPHSELDTLPFMATSTQCPPISGESPSTDNQGPHNLPPCTVEPMERLGGGMHHAAFVSPTRTYVTRVIKENRFPDSCQPQEKVANNIIGSAINMVLAEKFGPEMKIMHPSTNHRECRDLSKPLEPVTCAEDVAFLEHSKIDQLYMDMFQTVPYEDIAHLWLKVLNYIPDKTNRKANRVTLLLTFMYGNADNQGQNIGVTGDGTFVHLDNDWRYGGPKHLLSFSDAMMMLERITIAYRIPFSKIDVTPKEVRKAIEIYKEALLSEDVQTFFDTQTTLEELGKELELVKEAERMYGNENFFDTETWRENMYKPTFSLIPHDEIVFF